MYNAVIAIKMMQLNDEYMVKYHTVLFIKSDVKMLMCVCACVFFCCFFLYGWFFLWLISYNQL